MVNRDIWNKSNRPEPDHNVFTNEVITLMSQSKYGGDKSETESRPQSNIGTRVILSRWDKSELY